MKKTLTVTLAFLAVAASSLTAAYQYGNYVQYDFATNPVQNRKLTVVQDSNLTLSFLKNPYYSPNGYEIGDWDSLKVEITDGTSGQKTFRDFDITSTTVNIGDFMSGQSLFFYVSSKKGTTFTTQDKQLGYQFWDSSANMPDSLFFDGNYGKNNNKYAQLTFRIGGSPVAPTGQPLPGVVVSMLLGSGFLLLKRRKASVLC